VKKLVFLFVSEEHSEARGEPPLGGGDFMDLDEIGKALEDGWMD